MANHEWILIEQFVLDTDLLPLLRHLTVLGVGCHVTEADNRQQLFIHDPEKYSEVKQIVIQWQQGNLVVLGEQNNSARPVAKLNKVAFVKALPITLMTILLGFVGTGLVMLDQQTLYFAEPFLFQPMIHGNMFPAVVGIERGEYWRLLTPMFLHFGIAHVVFNSLLIWLIGHRIEIAKSSLHLTLILLLTGMVANLTQFFMTPNTVFGGLSGAAYGLVGYIMVYQRLCEHPILQFPKGMIIVLIVSLFLGVFGVFDLFMGDAGIANGAHIGGLLTGIVLGFLVAIMDKNLMKNSNS